MGGERGERDSRGGGVAYIQASRHPTTERHKLKGGRGTMHQPTETRSSWRQRRVRRRQRMRVRRSRVVHRLAPIAPVLRHTPRVPARGSIERRVARLQLVPVPTRVLIVILHPIRRVVRVRHRRRVRERVPRRGRRRLRRRSGGGSHARQWRRCGLW